MDVVIELLATIAVGAALGLVLRLKIPGGMLVGGILGAAILNIGFDFYYMPAQAKILAQLTAGAFIGTGVTRSDIYHLRNIWLLFPRYFRRSFVWCYGSSGHR